VDGLKTPIENFSVFPAKLSQASASDGQKFAKKKVIHSNS